MLIKALCSFSGTVSMVPGEKRDVTEETGRDLIRAGFAVSAEEKRSKPLRKLPNRLRRSPQRSLLERNPLRRRLDDV